MRNILEVRLVMGGGKGEGSSEIHSWGKGGRFPGYAFSRFMLMNLKRRQLRANNYLAAKTE